METLFVAASFCIDRDHLKKRDSSIVTKIELIVIMTEKVGARTADAVFSRKIIFWSATFLDESDEIDVKSLCDEFTKTFCSKRKTKQIF